MPASQPQAITEVAKPVAVVAAWRAHSGLAAVMTRRVARMPKASAKVSSMATPSMLSALMPQRVRQGCTTSPGARPQLAHLVVADLEVRACDIVW